MSWLPCLPPGSSQPRDRTLPGQGEMGNSNRKTLQLHSTQFDAVVDVQLLNCV